ncbi:MAG: amidohydrolase family protein [Lentisphaerae bacterium]|jgi:predicted TIM-barrel fold metal-dependent hydrolase|nr:amidohydrolase family protein [Lentisphaerota bacterium]MBT4819626.1 amidohydrolase family protein [Lentisphaerota bacterium]MBT5604425.1 amidohydrolase family protein [Lentisphaerota bacterium]MBT7058182.1 amidohydrolase family protein [Lentisphaerota bacterium]MBT7847434.1 amidohydrolase family protein [Lentisphaerota bacterium]
MTFYNHCHVFPHGAFPDAPELGTLPELDLFMKDNGVDKAVAFAPFWGPRTREILDGEEINAWLLRNLEPYPNIVGAMAVNPTDPKACEIVEEYHRKGFIGIKTHPAAMRFQIDDPACDDFYACAAELGLFVLFHTGVHGWVLSKYQPLLIDNVVCRHPNVTVIIEHMGTSDGIGRGFFDQALAVITNHSNRWRTDGGVYAGLTGLAKPQHRQLLADTIAQAGPERCIFGLDWPHMEGNARARDRYRMELDVLRSLRLPQAAEDTILGGALSALTGVQ